MKRYYAKSVRRLLTPGIDHQDAEANEKTAEAAQLLTRIRQAATGNALENALFHVLDAALRKQAERRARERNRNRRHTAEKPRRKKRTKHTR